jgi:phage recombination protein Bet
MSDQTEITKYQQRMEAAYTEKAITVAPRNGELSVFSKDQVSLLKRTILDEKTTDDELMLFSMICQRTGLDPFARQIYGIRRWQNGSEKLTIQTSIDGCRLMADRTGKYAGSEDPVFDGGLSLYEAISSGRQLPITATVTVWKICGGQRCPFTASASFQQYAQFKKDGSLMPTWVKMPHLMLSKCAEALALRKAFPAELSGIYTGEEMSSIDNPVEIIPPTLTPVAVPKPQIKNPPSANNEAWRDWKSLEDAIEWAVNFAGITKGRAYEIYESIQPEIIRGREIKAPNFEIAIKNLTDVF